MTILQVILVCRYSTRIGAAVFLFALMFPVFSVAHAGNGESDPSVSSSMMGFNSLVPVGKWTSMSVRIKNPGPEASGFVDLESIGSQGASSRLFTRRIWLPEGCERVARYPVRFEIDKNTDYGETGKFMGYIVRVTASDIVVDDNKFYYKPIDPYHLLVAGIDKDGGRYKEIEEGYLNELDRSITTTGWIPWDAPERTQEYLCCEAVILADLGEFSLTTMQQQSLIDWVKSGGMLVISPGKDPGRFRNTMIEQLLPVEITGVRMANRMECLDRFDPVPWFPEKPIHVMESVRIGGEVLLEDKGLPIAVEVPFGLGKIIYVAPDISDDRIRKWEGFDDFIVFIIDRPSQMLPYEDELMAEEAAGILNSFAGIKVPQRSSVVIYLTAMMLIMIVPPLILRKKGREGIGWGIAVAAALVATIVAGKVGKSFKEMEETSVNEVYIAKSVSGQRETKVSGFAGIITPSREAFDIASGSPSITLDPTVSDMGQRTFTVFETSFEDAMSVNRFLVNRNSMRSFAFSGSYSTYGVIDAACELTETGLELRVTNGTDRELADGFMKYNRLVIRVPDAGPGQTVTASYSNSGSPAETPIYSSLALGGRDFVIRNQLRKCFFPDPVVDIEKMGISLASIKAVPRFAGAGYFGWSDTISGAVNVSRVQTRRGIGLFAVRTPVMRKGDQVLIPRGICEMKLPDNISVGSRTGEVMTGIFPADLEIEFTVPEICRGIRAERITLFWDFRSKTVEGELFIGTPGKGDYINTGNGRVLEISDPARFLDGTLSTVYLKVEMEKTAQKAGTELALVDSSWQIWGLDIEIEGRVANDN